MKKRLWALLLLLAFLGVAQAAVDVNTAAQSELETVRGIGPALSARIIEARKQGPFKDIEDLQQRVRGIGEASGRKLVQAGLVVGSAKAAAGAGTAGAGAAAKPGTTSKSDASAAASPAAGASVTRATVGKGVVSEVKPGPEKAADQSAPKAPAKTTSSPAPGANPPPADPKK